MNLNDPIFTDEAKAREYFESLRWPNGPLCPHCGETEKVYRLEGQSHRPGLIHCNSCSGSFTVTTGGVMESSHIPLTKWALGFQLMASSKKGISAHQLHRSLGITYKSAWFMAMRIREAMGIAPTDKLGGEGQIVEADDAEVGRSNKTRHRPRSKNLKFVSLVERGGRVRSRKLTGAKGEIGREIRNALYTNVDRDSILHTDGGSPLKTAWPIDRHSTVDHNKRFVGVDAEARPVHTNTAEGYFSIFKRGLVGTYQHMSEQHLPRYLNEFDFRMSNRAALGVNDDLRTERAIQGAEGKRLTYRQPHSA